MRKLVWNRIVHLSSLMLAVFQRIEWSTPARSRT